MTGRGSRGTCRGDLTCAVTWCLYVRAMIIVTGAAGFIGSCLVSELERAGYADIVAVDDFSHAEKARNLAGRMLSARVDRGEFLEWLDRHENQVQFIFHLGARTDTTEFDTRIFEELNVRYSQAVWDRCVRHGLPLVYASSAATYGAGEHGYEDDHAIVPKLHPLNPYGDSKQAFDRWVLDRERRPFFWAGLKFFNVYGPNEYHKKRMASVVFHAHNQIKATGGMKLFRSHRPEYKDGEQLRDFIYVKDVCDVCIWLMEHRRNSGIYNLGSGRARTFLDLARATFAAMGLPERIEFIDTPVDIRDKYQYFTEARMDKLRRSGYDRPFTSLEDGVRDYMKEYLVPDRTL